MLSTSVNEKNWHEWIVYGSLQCYKISGAFCTCRVDDDVIPMLIEQVSARTVGYAQSNSIFSDPHFTNVIGKLTAGKWIHHPRLLGTGWGIEWETAGSGVFGGNEKGTVEADFGP